MTVEKLTIEKQKFREGFEKWHIRGFPFHLAFHKISAPDFGVIHDHPTKIRITILYGSYWERVYTVNDDRTWSYADFHRQPGETREMEANTIHEILSLPEGVCYTMIQPGPIERDWGFWKFDEKGAHYRQHDQSEFES